MSVTRVYKLVLFESNLFNTDLHPVTGIATPGLHSAVATITQTDGVQLSLQLNKPGNLRFTVPLNGIAAPKIVGYEIRRSVVVYASTKDSWQAKTYTPVWSGYISALDLDAASNKLNVTVTGWMELLYHREFRTDVGFQAAEAGPIAYKILAMANLQNSNASGYKDDELDGGGEMEYDGTDNGRGTAYYIVGTRDSANNLLGNFTTLTRMKDGNWTKSGNSALRLDMRSQGTGVSQLTVVTPGTPKVLPPRPEARLNWFAPTPGATYNLQGFYRLVTKTGTLTSLRLQINWVKADGKTFSSITPSSSFTLPTAAAIGVEQSFNTNMTAPSDAVYAWLFLWLEIPSGTLNQHMWAVDFDSIKISRTAVNIVATPIVQGTSYPDDGTGLTNPVGANRTRAWRKGDKMGRAIEELSDIEAGFDWDVSTTLRTISGGDTLQRELNIYYGQIKAGLNGRGEDNTEILFGYKAFRNNLTNARETRDGSNLTTKQNVSAAAINAQATDTAGVSLYGIWEDTITISDAGSADGDTLLGYAGAELAYKSVPVRRFDLSPVPISLSVGSTTIPYKQPWIFYDYDIGDIVYFTADVGAMQIGNTGSPQAIRIFGVNLSIDKNGNEHIDSFQTAAS